MALEKMNLENALPLGVKIEEDLKAFIDLDEVYISPKDIVLEWHLEIRNFFLRYKQDNEEAKLTNLMNYYIESLRHRAIHFEDVDTLKLMMDKHLEHIHWLYKDFDICYPESYLDLMEHILTFYVNLSIRVMLDLKNKRKITERMIKNVAWAVVQRLTQYLLTSEYHIHHVLIRQSSSLVEDLVRDILEIHNSFICKAILRKMYCHFLANRPLKDQSDEAFCRIFILFENWKVFDNHEHVDDIERLMAKQFGKDSACIKNNEFLKKILEPETTVLTRLQSVVGCDASITKAYFDYIQSKQKVSAEILDDMGKLSQDMSSSSDLDWDEDDEDARYKELYQNVVGKTRKHKNPVFDTVKPVVKEEKPIHFENLSIEDEIHIIDSDSDSVELISIIPSQKNRTAQIMYRMENTSSEEVIESFLDNIPRSCKSSITKIDIESRRDWNKSTVVDKNQNESFNPAKPIASEDICNENREVTVEKEKDTVDAQLDSAMRDLTVAEQFNSTKDVPQINDSSKDTEISTSNVEKDGPIHVLPTTEVVEHITSSPSPQCENACNQSTENVTPEKNLSDPILDTNESIVPEVDSSELTCQNTPSKDIVLSKNSNKILATIKTWIFRKPISDSATESQKDPDFIDDLFENAPPIIKHVPETTPEPIQKETPEIVTIKETLNSREPDQKSPEKIGGSEMPTLERTNFEFDTSNSEDTDKTSDSPPILIRIDFCKTPEENGTVKSTIPSSTPIRQTSNVKEIPEIIEEPPKTQLVPLDLTRNNEQRVLVNENMRRKDTLPSFYNQKIADKEIGADENCTIAHEPDEPMEVNAQLPCNDLEKRSVSLTQLDDDTQNGFEIEISTNEHLSRENISIKVKKKSIFQNKRCGHLDTGQPILVQDTGQAHLPQPDLNDEMVIDQTSAQNPIITTDQNVEDAKLLMSKDVQRVISPPGYLTPPGSDKEGDKNAEEFPSSVYTNITTEPFADDDNICCADQGESSGNVKNTELDDSVDTRIAATNSSLAKTYEQIVADAVSSQNSTEDEMEDCDVILDVENVDIDDTTETQSQQPVDTFDDMEQFLKNCEDDDANLLPPSKKRKNLTKGDVLSDNNESSNKPAPAKSKKRVKVSIVEAPQTISDQIDPDSIKTETDLAVPANPENKNRRSRRKKEKNTDVDPDKSTSAYNNTPNNGLNHQTPPLSNNLIIKRPPLKGILKNNKGNPSYHPQHSLDDEIEYIVINVHHEPVQGMGKRVKILRKSFTAFKVTTEDSKLKFGAFVSVKRLSPSVLSVWEKITQRSRGYVAEDLPFSHPDDKPMYKIVFDKSTPGLNTNDRKYYCEPSNAEQGLENKFEAVNFYKNNGRSSTKKENSIRTDHHTPKRRRNISDDKKQGTGRGRKRKASVESAAPEEKKANQPIPKKPQAKGKQTGKANGARKPRGKKNTKVLEIGNS